MVIINPGNPTGQCLSEANLREILKYCYQENLVLVVSTPAENLYSIYSFFIFLDTDPHLASVVCDLYLFSVSRYELCVCGNLCVCVRMSAIWSRHQS
jgi:aspartate/methionine/tyrosine aminotransferase